MPTYWSKSLIPTLREVPSEAEVPSHQLMLRAGYIRKLGAGVYDYLPLGLRSLHKITAIIRQEMTRAGAIEVLLPALIPLELYQRTGRDQAYGDNLFKLKDRHGRTQALGPTHEEIITELVGGYVDSYRQLPLTLYQIQTKFRDEYRPRFGVLRSREFIMKDAYSFHTNVEGPGGLNEIYQAQFDAYCRIFQRCGLPFVTVEAESGPIGGSASHEFMVPSPTGEDTILESDKNNYAANVEKCEIGPRNYSASFPGGTLPAQPPKGELTKVHTPGCPGIDDVCAFFKKNLGSKLATRNMLKTLVYEPADETQRQATPFILAVVRGDHEVNEGKLKAVCGFAVQLADLQRAKQAGFAVGFVGPQVQLASRIFVDPDAAIDQFWVTGANEIDHHVKGFHWQRDVLAHLPLPVNAEASNNPTGSPRLLVADIRNAMAGDPSPKNDGGVLQARKGIEVGHVFKLGAKYTTALEVTAQNEKGERHPIIMGCYGIGVNRILAAAVEAAGGNDANGMILPPSIAPYTVVITTIRHEGQAAQVAEQLAQELEQLPGVEVLIDDRDERAGVKFKDADLIGVPIRITIGDKALAAGQVEFKPRRQAQADLVPLAEVARRVQEILNR